MDIDKNIVISHDVDKKTTVSDEISLNKNNLKDVKNDFDITINHNINDKTSVEVETTPVETTVTANVKF